VRGPFICCHHAHDVISVLKLFSLIERAWCNPEASPKETGQCKDEAIPKETGGQEHTFVKIPEAYYS
jgi:hypothetical protein